MNIVSISSVALLLVIGLYSVHATPADVCKQILTDSLNVQQDYRCVYMKNFTECALKVQGHTNPAIVTFDKLKNITAFYDNVIEHFIILQLNCKLDYIGILSDIYKESHGGQPSPVAPNVLPTLKKDDIDRCSKSLKSDGTSSCDLDVTAARKCLLKSAGFSDDNIATAAMISAMRTQIDTQIPVYRTRCYTDYVSVVNDLIQEGNGGQHSPVAPNVLPTLKKNDIDRCTISLKSDGTSSCDDVTAARKCLLKSAGCSDAKIATAAMISSMRTQIDTQIPVYRTRCYTDYESVVNELIQEGNGAASFSPPHLLAMGTFTVVAVMVLV